MLQVVEGGCILLLLGVFFAYVVAPAVRTVSLRVPIGRSRRPLPRTAAIALVYILLFASGTIVWRMTAPSVRQWVRVTAPAVIDRVFTDADRIAAVDRLSVRLPVPLRAQQAATVTTVALLSHVDGEVRAALDDVVGAARYVRWLAVAPIITFLLLAFAPGFQQSALGVLPHGHLRWRGDEYLRDVNAALAGWVRAQLAAGIIVALVCTTAFSLFRLPYAVSMGVVAGLLELLPVIGPLTVALMAAGQAGQHVVGVVLFLAAWRVVQDLVVYPRLIRNGLHLPAPAVILTVWLGAALNGAAGVVMAIPLAGFLSVSVRHWREYHAIERLVRTAARDK